jgi:hypothetical protein
MSNEEKERKLRAEEEKRDRELQKEHLELLKVKAGTSDGAALAAPPEEEKHYTLRKKIESFVYINKAYIVLFGIFAFIAIFLIINLISIVKPDVKIGIISDDRNFQALTPNVEELLSPYCPDFNGDGKSSVSVLYFIGPIDPEEQTAISEADSANVMKLSNEFLRHEMVMMILDDEMIEKMQLSHDVLADGTVIFPGDKNAVTEGYLLSGTDFAEAIGYPDMADDYIATFRAPKIGFVDSDEFEQNYENALIMWNNYLSGNRVN